ncbi:MAG TPA: hypothetical protein VKD72_24055 [Gemmataceae bacterium]|nr:hypothetical protein [Gemmataceae bacterium]
MTISFFLALLLADLPSPPTDAATVRAVWLADLDPARVQTGFVPGSRPDVVTGRWCAEAAGPPGVLRVVSFARGENDEGLDVAAPIAQRVSKGAATGYTESTDQGEKRGAN